MRDFCTGCSNVIWEDEYLQIKDTYNFCSLFCLSKYLSTKEDECRDKRPRSPKTTSKILNDQIGEKVTINTNNYYSVNNKRMKAFVINDGKQHTLNDLVNNENSKDKKKSDLSRRKLSF